MAGRVCLGVEKKKHWLGKKCGKHKVSCFPNIFLKGFCSNTQKIKSIIWCILSRWNSTFDKKFSVIVRFAPYTRHLGSLFFRKTKCVALRNCLKKRFSFFIKSHDFHEVSPNIKTVHYEHCSKLRVFSIQNIANLEKNWKKSMFSGILICPVCKQYIISCALPF